MVSVELGVLIVVQPLMLEESVVSDMNIMQKTCDNCDGMGYIIDYFITPGVYDEYGFHKRQSEEVVCKQCNGKGYTEYAVFSVEEAEAILKYCNLSTAN